MGILRISFEKRKGKGFEPSHQFPLIDEMDERIWLYSMTSSAGNASEKPIGEERPSFGKDHRGGRERLR